MVESFLSPLTKGIFRINLHMSGRVIVYYSTGHILWAASEGFQGKTGREFLCDVAPNGSVVSAGMVREEPSSGAGTCCSHQAAFSSYSKILWTWLLYVRTIECITRSVAFSTNNKIHHNTVFVFCPHLPVHLLWHVYFAWKMRWGGLTAK